MRCRSCAARAHAARFAGAASPRLCAPPELRRPPARAAHFARAAPPAAAPLIPRSSAACGSAYPIEAREI